MFGFILGIGALAWFGIVGWGLVALRAELERADSEVARVLAGIGLVCIAFGVVSWTSGQMSSMGLGASADPNSNAGNALAQLASGWSDPAVTHIAFCAGMFLLSVCVAILLRRKAQRERQQGM